MDILKPVAVIGTNAWGGKLYGKAIRGNYVEDTVIKDAMQMAQSCDIPIYDLARDYGFGKAQKMIGEFGTDDVFIRAEGLIPRPSGAKQGVLNPTAIPYENTIPRCSAAGLVISAKYTPFTHYKKGRVRKSLVKDLDDFKRDYVDNQT